VQSYEGWRLPLRLQVPPGLLRGHYPLHRCYETVRPSPAHRYSQPRGWSRLSLVKQDPSATSRGRKTRMGESIAPGAASEAPNRGLCSAGRCGLVARKGGRFFRSPLNSGSRAFAGFLARSFSRPAETPAPWDARRSSARSLPWASFAALWRPRRFDRTR